MKAMLRGTLATLVGSMALLAASTAFAEGEACYNDIDCPGTACGDAVCNWTKSAPVPMGMKVFACNPAGSQPAGADGWCTVDSDCKCASQGAKCVAPYCTFTKPKTAGTGGAASTGGTTSSTGGAVSSTGGAVASTGGTVSSTGGTTSSTGGTASSTGGTTPSTGGAAASTDDGGGCSVSVPGGTNSGLALGAGLLGLGIAFARRRRH
jgi:MYXO-CTERM domain-containing protein